MVSAFLTIGTDSPVKEHSFMSTLPSRTTPSKGTLIGSSKNTISPGTRSRESIYFTAPSLNTFTFVVQ